MPSLVTTGIPILWGPGFLLAFVVLGLAIGRRCLIWLGVTQGSRVERGIVAFALGSGTLQLVPLALGTFGLLGVRAVWAALALVTLLASYDLLRVLLAARDLLGHLKASRFPLWTLALAPGLVAACLLALTPTLDADGLGYHLTVPKRWLASGSLSYLPTYPNSNMPMGVEMLFTLALAVSGDAAAKILHYALGVSGAIALYLAGLRL